VFFVKKIQDMLHLYMVSWERPVLKKFLNFVNGPLLSSFALESLPQTCLYLHLHLVNYIQGWILIL